MMQWSRKDPELFGSQLRGMANNGPMDSYFSYLVSIRLRLVLV